MTKPPRKVSWWLGDVQDAFTWNKPPKIWTTDIGQVRLDHQCHWRCSRLVIGYTWEPPSSHRLVLYQWEIFRILKWRYVRTRGPRSALFGDPPGPKPKKKPTPRANGTFRAEAASNIYILIYIYMYIYMIDKYIYIYICVCVYIYMYGVIDIYAYCFFYYYIVIFNSSWVDLG